MSAPTPSIGFVSTFPPTVCGIASYTSALVGALSANDPRARIGVVGLSDGPTVRAEPPVVFRHRNDDHSSLRTAIAILNGYEAVSIQHEFGILGGTDGVEVLELMAGLRVPTAVTLHTVLVDPTPHQREIMDRICRQADLLMVMSRTAFDRLVTIYRVDPVKIVVIPHGVDLEFGGQSLAAGERPVILTWGLIGPGKGLEWAIAASANLLRMNPLPRYLIVGATHPQVRLRSGETYRNGLIDLTAGLGLDEIVEFDDRYLSRRELARLVRSADVVVLPYESAEQITSGVLVEAITACKPVIATRFPHAVELLSSGAGSLVPAGDSGAMGAEMLRILTDRAARTAMSDKAGEMAEGWYWPTVAERFVAAVSDVAIGRTFGAATGSRQLAAG